MSNTEKDVISAKKYKDWMQGLKVGDKILVRYEYYFSKYFSPLFQIIKSIDRDVIRLDDNRPFRRIDGRNVARFPMSKIYPYDENTLREAKEMAEKNIRNISTK